MATVTKQVRIGKPAPLVWDAVEDVGALDRRVAPALVINSSYDSSTETRRVEFANGMVLDEPIVSCDTQRMRLAWTALGGEWGHHNASMTVDVIDGDSCIVTWTADILPHDQAEGIAPLMEAGLANMQETLEKI